MNKYIDAEKLIAYLKKTMESYKSQMVDPTKYPIEHIDLMAFLAREYQAIIANVESLQQEQPEVDLEKEIEMYISSKGLLDHAFLVPSIARHFYGLRNRALEEAARHVYESWNGGTMDDVRRDMVELGKVLNARKEE